MLEHPYALTKTSQRIKDYAYTNLTSETNYYNIITCRITQYSNLEAQVFAYN